MEDEAEVQAVNRLRNANGTYAPDPPPPFEPNPLWRTLCDYKRALDADPGLKARLEEQSPDLAAQLAQIARNPLLLYEPWDVAGGRLPDGNPKSSPLAFHRDSAQIRVVVTGNRCSKTFSAAAEVGSRCLGVDPVTKQKLPGPFSPLDVWVVSKTEGASIEQAQAAYAALLPWDFVDDRTVWDRTTGFRNAAIQFAKPYESVIRFKYTKQDLQTFAGTYKDIIHLDEEQPKPYWTECLARTTGVAGKPPGRIIITFTPIYDPDVGISWVQTDLYSRRHEIPSLSFHGWTLEDVPDWIVPAAEKARLIASYDPDEREARVYGMFTPTGMQLAFSRELIAAARQTAMAGEIGWLVPRQMQKQVPQDSVRYLPSGAPWPTSTQVETRIEFQREETR